MRIGFCLSLIICRVEFGTCEVDFGTCEVDFSTCEVDFSTCEVDFGTCEVDFGTCEVPRLKQVLEGVYMTENCPWYSMVTLPP